MEAINPHFDAYKGNNPIDVDKLFNLLKAGNIAALSKAITLIESTSPRHKNMAEKLMHWALPLSGNAIRIGITGVPGVGKSTFIEAFGEHLTQQGKKVAVLAIDPTSSKNKGSILGDKTRMEKLSQNNMAFIRPSPSSGSLGGVAHKTRASILLCEAAGFDCIIVETVGVGQSETAVKSMVDFFLLLMLAGAGDELQGIKRGIMEMADLLVINKADGENLQAAKRAKGEYKRALHLFPPNANEWIPQVETISALQNEGIAKVDEIVQSFKNQQQLKGHFEENRKQQALNWFEESLGELLYESFHNNPQIQKKLIEVKTKITSGKIDPYWAAKSLITDFIQSPSIS